MKRPINTIAILHTEAMRLARLAVKAEMRARMIKVNYVAASEITRAARARLRQHPELMQEAFGNVIHWQLERLLRRAKMQSAAQKSNVQKSIASTVQQLGAK